MSNTKHTLGRREFLKIAAVAGVVATGSKALARKASASTPEGSSPHQWAMIIDQGKCTGDGYCTIACQAHNDVAPEISWNRVD